MTLFWYNPNIHPEEEYVKRMCTLKRYAEELGLPLIVEGEYGLERFVHGLEEQGPAPACFDAPGRCTFCYSVRMEKTAAIAKEKGFDAFCTTLFISPYQNHELLREQAEKASKQYGTALLYRDFRPRFREGQREARRLGLYMQKYCGCTFSAK
jgi:predicted adenine nucleotide alpha hydrolase (AANH) superfamily ATPase